MVSQKKIISRTLKKISFLHPACNPCYSSEAGNLASILPEMKEEIAEMLFCKQSELVIPILKQYSINEVAVIIHF